MPDIEELRRVLTHVVAHPDSHQQEKWTCDTGACFAGHAALLNNYHLAVSPTLVAGGDPHVENGVVISSKGERKWVPDVARDILDLGYGDSDILFHSENNVQMLAQMIEDLEHGEELQTLWDYSEDRESDQLVRIGKKASGS